MKNKVFMPLTFSIMCMASISAPFIYETSLHASTETIPKSLMQTRNFPKQPMLKVLLAEDQESFVVEVNGTYNVYDPYTGKKLESAFSKSSYEMIPTVEGIKWGPEFPGIYQILLIPDSKESSVIVNGIQYPGAVAFYIVESTLAAVNWVSLEDFTTSILSSSFFPKDQDQREALSAYAIAVRSLAYQALLQSTHGFWDITANSAGYKGRSVERTDKKFIDAMKVSQGVVLAGNINSSADMSLSKAFSNAFDKMPFDEIAAMAAGGQDARKILEKFFPGEVLTVIKEPVKK